MTPEEARALEPGTTPGPWKPVSRDHHTAETPTNIMTSAGHVLATYDGGMGEDPEWANPADLPLIAAAPDMRATIAGMRVQWGVERDVAVEPGRRAVWFEDLDMARVGLTDPAYGMTRLNPRLVRRLVGPTEETE